MQKVRNEVLLEGLQGGSSRCRGWEKAFVWSMGEQKEEYQDAVGD